MQVIEECWRNTVAIELVGTQIWVHRRFPSAGRASAPGVAVTTIVARCFFNDDGLDNSLDHLFGRRRGLASCEAC